MLTPEDSQRVADRITQAIERIENRVIILLNETQDKLTLRTDIQKAIADGVKSGFIESGQKRR